MLRSDNKVHLGKLMDTVINQSHMPLMLLLMQHTSLTVLSLSITHHSHTQLSLTELNLSIILISLMVHSLSMLHPNLMAPISLTDISPTVLSLHTLHPSHTVPTVLINPTELNQSTLLHLTMERSQFTVLISLSTGLIHQRMVLLMHRNLTK